MRLVSMGRIQNRDENTERLTPMPHTGLNSFDDIYARHTTVQDFILANRYWFDFMDKCHSRYWSMPDRAGLTYGPHAIAGIAAALSPNQSEKTMWLGVDRLITGKHNLVGYGRDQDRACRIWNNEHPLDVLGGRKTRTFYDNITDPDNASGLVTVDGHMINAWRGEVRLLKTIRMTDAQYTEVEQGVQAFARLRNMRPSHMQALLWFGWKRKHRILDNPQLAFIF
jgi:hypothetical protein